MGILIVGFAGIFSGAYEAKDNGNWILIHASKRERS